MASVSERHGRLAGQVAVVTGGGSGIGRAACLALAAEGARVAVVDLDPAAITATVAELDRRSQPCPGRDGPLGLPLDVRREADMEAMARRTLERFGRIDLCIASAGILRPPGGAPSLVAEMAAPDWRQVLDTNLTGVFLANRAMLPAMARQRGGCIINISSVSGRLGRAYDSAYCASKAGVIALSEALAEEVRQQNIRVQVVLPDAVDTPLWDQNGPIPKPVEILPAERVADLLVVLATLPADTLLVNPVIAPFRSRRQPFRPGQGGGRAR